MDQKNTRVKVSFASEFRKPVHALLNGEPVRITHVGDADGMSPVYLCVDAQGTSAWQPQGQVQIIDQDFLPLSREALETIRTSAGSSYPRTSGTRT